MRQRNGVPGHAGFMNIQAQQSILCSTGIGATDGGGDSVHGRPSREAKKTPNRVSSELQAAVAQVHKQQIRSGMAGRQRGWQSSFLPSGREGTAFHYVRMWQPPLPKGGTPRAPLAARTSEKHCQITIVCICMRRWLPVGMPWANGFCLSYMQLERQKKRNNLTVNKSEELNDVK